MCTNKWLQMANPLCPSVFPAKEIAGGKSQFTCFNLTKQKDREAMQRPLKVLEKAVTLLWLTIPVPGGQNKG